MCVYALSHVMSCPHMCMGCGSCSALTVIHSLSFMHTHSESMRTHAVDCIYAKNIESPLLQCPFR